MYDFNNQSPQDPCLMVKQENIKTETTVFKKEPQLTEDHKKNDMEEERKQDKNLKENIKREETKMMLVKSIKREIDEDSFKQKYLKISQDHSRLIDGYEVQKEMLREKEKHIRNLKIRIRQLEKRDRRNSIEYLELESEAE